jgi:ABC-type phosphate/phosphonate transport system permease subunit
MKISDKLYLAQGVLAVLGIGALAIPPLIFGPHWEQWTSYAWQLNVFAMYVLPPVAAVGLVCSCDFFVRPQSWPKIISFFISLAGVIFVIDYVATFTGAP